MTDLARIAVAVGVADGLFGPGDAARGLINHLTHRPGHSLVVFDSAVDPEVVRDYLPPTGNTAVLITTTDAAFDELGDVVTVEEFSRAESIRFLHDRTVLPGRTGTSDPEGADLVAEELGDLPLALAAAAAVIRQRRLTFGRYLDQLRSYPLDKVLSAIPGQGYPRSTAAALALSLDHAAGDDPSGLTGRTLDLMSVLSPRGVGFTLLAALMEADGNDPLAFDEALQQCTRRTLLSWSALEDVLVMHRLTARVIRERAATTGALDEIVEVAADKLDTLIQSMETLTFDSVTLMPQIGAHVEALWAITAERRGHPARKCLELRVRIGGAHLMGPNGPGMQSFAQYPQYAHRLVADCERMFGGDHPATVRARLALAGLDSSTTDGAGPNEIDLDPVLADCKRILGEHDPSSLRWRIDLATAALVIVETPDDELLALAAHTLREGLGSASTLQTITLTTSLADAYRASGSPTAAIDLLERACTRNEDVSGNAGNATVLLKPALAQALASDGRTDEALAVLDPTLARSRESGWSGPATLHAAYVVVQILTDAHRFDAAVEASTRYVTDTRDALGPDHYITIMAEGLRAVSYFSAGRHLDAFELLKGTLAKADATLGREHMLTVQILGLLQVAYMEAGQTDEVLALVRSRQDVYRRLEVLLDPDAEPTFLDF